jgi:glycerol kinase
VSNRPAILAIDQGTTSSRAIVFNAEGEPLASARRELPQIFPRSGWVEHDAERIWLDSLAVAREAVAGAGLSAADIACLGIANQRETTVIWERGSGKPIANAIVWQDRRTSATCARLKEEGLEERVQSKTGLLIDPYFSATKIAWLLDNTADARAAAERGELAFGTIDCWLLWNLTGGAVHATDATNASRTMLFDIHTQAWDPELLGLLGVPAALLPEVRDCDAEFGATAPELLGAPVPITGIAGDQQAALVGQAGFEPGILKSTYGTGCFALLNTGPEPVRSRNRLLTTVAYRLGGETAYALEGSIFVAGAALQWLRDALGLIADAAESEDLAAALQSTGGVYLVPAFTGLGAPHWDPDARGALVGLSRDSGRAEIVRAALEAAAYQTRDLIGAMVADGAAPPVSLRVDGGMADNDWLLQFLADILDLTVERPAVTETTALGAAYLAGLGAGIHGGTADIARHWRRQRAFTPAMDAATRAALCGGWQHAVARTLSKTPAIC